MAKTNSGLLEFKDEQKVLIALDDATSEVKKAVIIDADGNETDIAGEGVTVEALSVTENGTYSEEGKAYSPVTVNVEGGSSDFSTAEVRVVNNSGNNVLGGLVAIIDTPTPMVSVQTGFFINMDMTVKVPLYKGMCMWVVNDPNLTVSVTGNITNDGGMLTITGDGTITISAGE